MYLCVLDLPNLHPGDDGNFELKNVGAPPKGTLYLDVNPGEFSKPINFIYVQTSDPELKNRVPRAATYSAEMEGQAVPLPQSLRDITAIMNEGQFLELTLNDKGVLLVPRSRRALVLEYLGFRTK